MINTYPPRDFAKMVGRSVGTLQRWDRVGVLNAHRTPTNKRYYTHDQYLGYIGQVPAERQVVSYARVSGSAQKKDLASQKKAIEEFCIASGRAPGQVLEDIGSGLNYKRRNFVKIMEMVEQGKISEIVVAHKDRLVRFGFEWFEKFCRDHGCQIVVMNAASASPEEEMTKDLLAIIHCFSSRLYGLRKYERSIRRQVRARA